MDIVQITEIGLPKAVTQAADVLRSGGLLIYPTDTIYGLGVDARNGEAVRRLKEVKGREATKPISVMVADLAALEACAVMTDAARALAEKHLPGPLTLVLEARESLRGVAAVDGTIGVRIPNNEFCILLVKACGFPITATSANRSGLETPTTVNELAIHFGVQTEAIDLAIDGGESLGGAPSTIVSCVGEPTIIREGTLTREALGL